MIDVIVQSKEYKAFYYKDVDQDEVNEIVRSELAVRLNANLDGEGIKEELFLKIGEYSSTSCGKKDVPPTDKLVSVQRGNWIVVSFKKEDGDEILLSCKVVSSKTMVSRYKCLIEDMNLTLEGYEKQPMLFDSVEIEQDEKVIMRIENPNKKA